ncbi:MAG TPA: pyridoxamine 5'-phosphate oxidase family protein [Baekduia sp.]|uniref:pyridoxamine 5'-phosphate oxidase family protein n=1 Tax=Baekduia sp. TaxID=2600305 RepID=UPI002B8AD6E7|nr:pyridoxamine 5'-phosphate oxidase family protein [Baekduia sp.]HMJ32382.1 pyridoxamine 5'-phosphate oxidase family protein [Baekduia sp.]
MTATLPSELRDVFAGCTSAELVTIDDRGRPVARSVTPAYRPGGPCIDVAERETVVDPHVALLFADDGPMVLVQGTARAADGLHVQPERVYAWRSDDPDAEPRLFDTHLEEVRSGHNEEPEVGHRGPEGGDAVWDARLEALDSALLACVGPDGFPFAARLQVAPDAGDGVLRLPRLPVGMPVEAGPACLHARRGPRVHGDLVRQSGGWAFVPHAVLDA